MMKKFIIIFAALLPVWLPAGAYAADKHRSIYSISGYYLGVVRDGNLFCYYLDDDEWIKCTGWTPIPIPADVAFVTENERRIAVVQKGNVKYYDEGGDLYERCSHALPGSLNKDSQVFRNLGSTECEFVVRDGNYLYTYDPEHTSKETAEKLKFDCKEVDQASDVFWFGLRGRLAEVKDNSLRVYQIHPFGASRLEGFKCLPEPERTLNFDVPQDEIAVINGGRMNEEYGDVVAAKKGNVINFYEYSEKLKLWRKAWTSDDLSEQVPVFLTGAHPSLSCSPSLISHEAPVFLTDAHIPGASSIVQRDDRYYLYRDGKPLSEGYDYLEIDRNFVYARQDKLHGVLDRRTGKVLLPLEYASIYYSWVPVDSGILTALAKRDGKLFGITVHRGQLTSVVPAPKYLLSVILPPEQRVEPANRQNPLNGVYVKDLYPDLLSAWKGWNNNELNEPVQPSMIVQGDIAYLSYYLICEMGRNPMDPMRACQSGSVLTLRQINKNPADDCAAKTPPMFRFQRDGDGSLRCTSCDGQPAKWVPLQGAAGAM
jgi:hypothetical protein